MITVTEGMDRRRRTAIRPTGDYCTCLRLRGEAHGFQRVSFAHLVLVFLLLFVPSLFAASGGSISGTVSDSTSSLVAGAELQLVNTDQRTTWHAISNRQGLYSFPNLPVGRYDLIITANGFTTQRKTGLSVDTDSASRLDFVLGVRGRIDTVTVTSETGTHIETSATHLGEVVSGAQMAALPLNGRSYTDLLAIQPGVAPLSTLLPSSVIMAGVTGGISPSGDLNPGNLSINGQRESANGFMVNGIDVHEQMNGGTSIIPDLDSIEQFRVLTSNFDPEYGNYDGGIITVVSKAGTSQFHGRAFEFFRNTELDARGYFDPARSAFNQNQFGGALGGPIKRTKLFFFTDYQGTRTTQGVSTGNISVPTVAQRGGDFLNPTSGLTALTGSVSGPYLATLLTQQLGYLVTAGELYATVFPGGVIPQSAWAAPAKNLLHFIPSPNSGTSQFSTSAYSQKVSDDKGSVRLDLESRLGELSAYYFLDDYRLDNPYPGSVAGASIPGFDALTIGRAQLYSLGDTKVIGANTVNEFHVGYLRNANIIGQPKGGLGISLATQGFSTGPDGIYVQAPQFEGVENITFPTFVMGVPITNLTQVNNTWYVSDGLSRGAGSHSLKFGGQFHADEVNEHPNATFNGTFNINGTETGNPYADFLLGTPSNFTQSSGQPFYLRNRYFGLYAQNSWRARSNLTLNVGLRWDVIVPWWEKFNQLQTYIAGQQSTLYPGAPQGLVVAGDPGVPRTLASIGYKNFAPRVGFAYSPRLEHGLLSWIFGSNGQSSIRASYGIFYTAFPGLSAGIMYAVPPFGFNYLSPGPPLLAKPFITAATGIDNGQRFPFPFPSHNVSAKNPDTGVDWDNFLPLAADPFFDSRNRAAYSGNYMLSIQREITRETLLTLSYVGNQGHHILTLVSANPGDPALCMSLPGCGPFGEDSPYTDSNGKMVRGTRGGQGADYGENTADRSIANSNYNALETTLRYQHRGSQFLLSYTYGKSIDQGSNLGEQLNPINPRQSRTISAWDMKHAFVGSYTLAIPVADVLGKKTRLTEQWSLSGTARFTTGLPVTLFDNSDNSLLGTLGNGANNYLLDTPRYIPGALRVNLDGRNRRPAFDTALFPEETLGQLGNAKRRMFYGPGIDNLDMTLQKELRFSEFHSLEFRVEAFNVFNHPQFYGPATVNGQRGDPNFGQIQSAAAPRLVQLAIKFSF
ncbi:Carboxypeptidase regulatory-like domain-containing protein [Granulicella pectinivorans]|uniref:Carboxypeptidase regulatory-like domain-containing protein n=1 Tax=Granulicella pectinivorans TaxID=474950 RepID=A0A1I6MDJ5_9BACT|nr:carboxypeptidase regulatory-like domain-containing protein [Granulicella pectinivorans]SFS13789.1 Carboxypeptidase regulatory-like domain-containing protein [Granulicella pectinivorans]